MIAAPLLARFLSSDAVSLKICGVTLAEDAEALVALGIPALGVNFWPKSKRYLAADQAGWLPGLAGKILRVGVFVNAPAEEPLEWIRRGFIDVAQLHGDEGPADAEPLRQAALPFFKAFGVAGRETLAEAAAFGADAILLDAHAPGTYGGTGATFDWELARDFRLRHPEVPLLLAGGITPENAAAAAAAVRPAALDIASGAESAPGIKDLGKIKALLAALGPRG
jgi:phosphoribosylanthranilate isomerase